MVNKLDKLTDLKLKGFPGELNETPSSGISTLPTPDVNDEKWIDVHTFEWTAEDDRQNIEVPGAPRIRDLDSFTEGTGKGSFDSIPADVTNEFGEYILFPDSFSLGLLPEIDTGLFIAEWREGVGNADTVVEAVTGDHLLVDRDIMDTVDALSDISLEYGVPEDTSEGPRITFNITTSSSNLMPVSVPCNTKRARSSTPDPARRMRRRSSSRLSVRSAINRFDLTTFPFLCPPGSVDPSTALRAPPHSAHFSEYTNNTFEDGIYDLGDRRSTESLTFDLPHSKHMHLDLSTLLVRETITTTIRSVLIEVHPLAAILSWRS